MQNLLFVFILVSLMSPPNAKLAYLYGTPVAHPSLSFGNYHTSRFRLSETHELNFWSFTYMPEEQAYVLAKDPQTDFLLVLIKSSGQLGWMPSGQAKGLLDTNAIPAINPSFVPDYSEKYPVSP